LKKDLLQCCIISNNSNKKLKIMKVKSFFSMLFSSTLLAGTMVCFSSCDKDDDPVVEPNTLAKVATDNGLTTLVSAARTAGLESALKGTTQLTVFAPTNAAFTAAGSAIPTDPTALKNVLEYHILAGKIEASMVQERTLTYGVLSLNGADSLYVKRVGSNVFVNGTQVTTGNVQATNGVAHVIGKALIPPAGNVVQLAQAATGTFDSLVVAVLYATSAGPGSADIVAALTGLRNGTVFAPTNQAFRDLLAAQSPAATRISQLPKSLVVSVLQNHVLTSRYFSTDIPSGSTTLPALAGTITLNASATGVTIKGAGGTAGNVVLAGVNIVAKNGCVIHTIDKVLLP
jgi:uncharacterized surface protein with fasciclin (FAS1) repeats